MNLIELANRYELLARVASKCTECGTDNPYVDVEPYHCRLCKERKGALVGDMKPAQQTLGAKKERP